MYIQLRLVKTHVKIGNYHQKDNDGKIHVNSSVIIYDFCQLVLMLQLG